MLTIIKIEGHKYDTNQSVILSAFTFLLQVQKFLPTISTSLNNVITYNCTLPIWQQCYTTHSMPDHLVIVYPMHWIDPLISSFSVCLSVSLCVCEQIGCRTIMSTILYRFSQKFCMRLRSVVASSPIVCETNWK